MYKSALQSPEPRPYVDIYKKLIELWNSVQDYKRANPGWMNNRWQEQRLGSSLDVCSGLAYALGYDSLIKFVELNQKLQEETNANREKDK